ncbi:MAG: FAD-dependent oxidoreductase [Nitrososphaerales archaeon]
MNSNDRLYDLIIIGGASAGLTAALYAGRQGLKTLLVTKDIGGQALLTDSIQNYPGFINISGLELMKKFQEQAMLYGVKIKFEEVKEIKDKDGVCFTVRTTGGEYDACALILAFGKTPRDLGVEGEERLKSKGVSYCAICDGPLFRGKDVAVVGSSEPAAEAALLLSNIASKVHLIYKLAKLLAADELVEALRGKSNVLFMPESEVVRINGNNTVESVTIKEKGSVMRDIPVQGVFVEMGYVAKTDLVKHLVQLNAKNEIVTAKDGSTSHPGVFAAGDVTDSPYKQVVISAAQGAIAALSAYNYIQRLRGKPAIKGDWKNLPAAKTTQISLELNPV